MARTKFRSGAKPSDDAEKEKLKKETLLKIERPLMEKMLKVSSGRSAMKDLESLLTSFLSKLEPYLSGSNKTLEIAEKEKQQIKQRLIFFNSIYREIPEPKGNLQYLSKMSDLLARYIDVEVLTSACPFNVDSREGKDLISRIVTALYTSLESSEDHVLDTMMKLRGPFEENTPNLIDTPVNSAKSMKKKKDEDTSKIDVYSELFKIVVKKAEKHQVNDLTYMRYVLVYRLWKKMVKKNTAHKELVIKKASKLLLPPPFFLKRRWAYKCLSKVLPKPPKNTSNITEFYLREKYNVQKAVKTLLDETSSATQDRTMFLNLSCEPRLLNPKIQSFGPLPPIDAPIQEFSTFMSTADDVWRRLHEEPHSEASVFEQVTNFEKPPICTPNRVFNLLHSHHLQHKAHTAEIKKSALHKAFQSRSVVGGIITSHRISGSLSDTYTLSSPNTSNPVIRDSHIAKTHKRRILESPDIHLLKKNNQDSWDDNIHVKTHKRRILESPDRDIRIRSYVATGSLRKDYAQLAKVSLFSENPPKSIKETTDPKNPEKVVDVCCSSIANAPTDVKSEVKKEPSGWQSGSSCDSVQSSVDPDHLGKLAIEKEVEQTLQMLQKSNSPAIQTIAFPSIETSPIKTESEPSVVRVDDSNSCVVPINSETVSDRSSNNPTLSRSMWGYLGQAQDLTTGPNDTWLDDLLAYPPSTESQDFWSLVADNEIADYS